MSADRFLQLRQRWFFPDAVVGDVYSLTLTLANVTAVPHNVSISFAGTSVTTRIEANGTLRIPIGRGRPRWQGRCGSMRVSLLVRSPSLVGVLDIDNGAESGHDGSPAATDFLFPQVANGDGLFTGSGACHRRHPGNDHD